MRTKDLFEHQTASRRKCVNITQTLKESASASYRLSKKVCQHHTDSQRKCVNIIQTLKESASASHRRSKKVRQHHTDAQRKCVNIIQTLKESTSKCGIIIIISPVMLRRFRSLLMTSTFSCYLFFFPLLRLSLPLFSNDSANMHSLVK